MGFPAVVLTTGHPLHFLSCPQHTPLPAAADRSLLTGPQTACLPVLCPVQLTAQPVPSLQTPRQAHHLLTPTRAPTTPRIILHLSVFLCIFKLPFAHDHPYKAGITTPLSQGRRGAGPSCQQRHPTEARAPAESTVCLLLCQQALPRALLQPYPEASFLPPHGAPQGHSNSSCLPSWCFYPTKPLGLIPGKPSPVSQFPQPVAPSPFPMAPGTQESTRLLPHLYYLNCRTFQTRSPVPTWPTQWLHLQGNDGPDSLRLKAHQ